jgi:hypothetical protein
VSQIQIQRCADRIPDPAARARFISALTCADELIHQAAEMRRQAWADYRRATGEKKRETVGQYA